MVRSVMFSVLGVTLRAQSVTLNVESVTLDVQGVAYLLKAARDHQ